MDCIWTGIIIASRICKLMKFHELEKIVEDVKYKDWKFNLEDRMDCFLLKVTFMAPDLHTSKEELQHCRKWFISTHACRAEVVRTAYKAVLAAEQHEVDENFQYKGINIHSPHADPEALAYVFARDMVGKQKRMGSTPEEEARVDRIISGEEKP